MTTTTPPLSITVDAIVAGLDEFAYGQASAKRVLAEAAVGQLYEVHRSPVVLAAPTGTGKTLLATNLAKVLEKLLGRPVPCVVVDATALVPSGYKGLSLEERLEPQASKGHDQSLAGVIVIDEVDKLGSTGEPRFRAQCEASLLTLLNGDQMPIERRHGPFPSPSSGKGFDASRWMVIATGAFSDVRARLHRESEHVGFQQDDSASCRLPSATTMPLTLADLRAHGGLMAETWGRFTAMAELSPPTRDDLVRVAESSPNLRALVAQAAKRRISIEFGASFFQEAATRALGNHDSGYRAVAAAMHRACATLTDKLLPAARRRTAPLRIVLTGRDYAALQEGTWQLEACSTGPAPTPPTALGATVQAPLAQGPLAQGPRGQRD